MVASMRRMSLPSTSAEPRTAHRKCRRAHISREANFRQVSEACKLTLAAFEQIDASRNCCAFSAFKSTELADFAGADAAL